MLYIFPLYKGIGFFEIRNFAVSIKAWAAGIQQHCIKSYRRERKARRVFIASARGPKKKIFRIKLS